MPGPVINGVIFLVIPVTEMRSILIGSVPTGTMEEQMKEAYDGGKGVKRVVSVFFCVDVRIDPPSFFPAAHFGSTLQLRLNNNHADGSM